MGITRIFFATPGLQLEWGTPSRCGVLLPPEVLGPGNGSALGQPAERVTALSSRGHQNGLIQNVPNNPGWRNRGFRT